MAVEVSLCAYCTPVRLSMGILLVFVSCPYNAASRSNSGGRHSCSVTLLKLDAQVTDTRHCYFVSNVCVTPIIYATCYAPTYFRKIEDISVNSTSLVALEVVRNHHNFRCARSRIAILLAHCYSKIHGGDRQSETYLLLCSVSLS